MPNFTALTYPDIVAAAERIHDHIVRTPLLTSEFLNDLFGCQIYFKYEGAQKTGSFKLRGALNALLKLQENNALPPYIVTVSSGNHAQATAYAGKLLGVRVKIFFPPNPNEKKLQGAKSWGAETFVASSRQEAERLVAEEAVGGAFFLPPFDHDDIICGQGTSCLEALTDLGEVKAIFATCGGGGWLSGTYLAAQGLCPTAAVIGCEPLNGNDAAQSYRAGVVIGLPQAPDTVADGARTLKVAERTFQYLQKLNDFIEIPEDEILQYQRLAQEHLAVIVEPTSAVAFAGLARYLKQTPPQPQEKFLVLLSGSNV